MGRLSALGEATRVSRRKQECQCGTGAHFHTVVDVHSRVYIPQCQHSIGTLEMDLIVTCSHKIKMYIFHHLIFHPAAVPLMLSHY